MKITFCLPTHNYKSPIGGFKMVYEYANRLVARGHEVSLVFCTRNFFSKYHIPKIIKQLIACYVVYKSPIWFDLDKRVKKVSALELIDQYIPDGDIVVATAAQTAKYIYNLSSSKGRKFYYIQDYENWIINEEELIKTYQMGMTNIVVSNWLYDIVRKYSSDSNTFCIQNPIDTEIYKVDIPIEKRNPFSIGMLYHEAEYKGCKYALEAIMRVKSKYPQLQLYMFGNPQIPDFYANEEWIHYIRHADASQVVKTYNSCSIFLCASIKEGFGLTGLESMASGCALVSTEFNGVLEYAVDNSNSLLSPIRDVDTLVDNIELLINNEALRNKIAHKANEDAQLFSWENAMSKLDLILYKTER